MAQLDSNSKPQLTHIVGELARINSEMQKLRWEHKEVADAAWDKCGVSATVVKQLAKEQAWDEVKREKQRQHEEAVDECRLALGMLKDTPLGESAVADAEKSQLNGRKERKRNKKDKAEREAATT